MQCKYCGETDETKLTMSTRMINGKAVTVDVCLCCRWSEEYESGGKGKMKAGKILSKEDWKYIYKDKDFLEFLRRFYNQGKRKA